MAIKVHETTFGPNPVQKLFIESQATADLFSSRMGEGKSAAISWCPFFHTQRNPGANWAIIRDTWENLQATTQKEFFKWFPPGVFGEYNAGKKLFIWRVGGFENGEVQFLGMDDPADASKLQSRELAGFCIDEPAPAAESGGVSETIFDIGLSRLRQPGMKWYGSKLAQNNSDESHWTYRRFEDPGCDEFMCWQPPMPENNKNLPVDYYETLRRVWSHRPDLISRFIDGKFGFQALGKNVTPEWSDQIHLSHGLLPALRVPLVLLWDFGLNPTCIITQVTPLGHWNILDAFVGSEMGVAELCEQVVKPTLAAKYMRYQLKHVGDPAGVQREQSDSRQSAVKMIVKMLGGTWRSGPVRIHERIDPLRNVLRQTRQGKGMMQVDKENAREVWRCLRGDWHHKIGRNGIVSGEPVKNMASHPGDAMGYGSAVLFPLAKLNFKGYNVGNKVQPQQATFFGSGKPHPAGPLGFEKKGLVLPAEARILR